MRRARYQYGTVELSPRSAGPAVWVYRWRERSPQGKSVRKSAVLGTTEKYPTKAQALKAAEGNRLEANCESAATREVTFGALIDRYISEERLKQVKERPRTAGIPEDFDTESLDYSTASSYLSMLKVHIRPRWGNLPIAEVKPAAVQAWLRGLDLEPKTKGHLKATMHRLFEKAMLWELFPVDSQPDGPGAGERHQQAQASSGGVDGGTVHQHHRSTSRAVSDDGDRSDLPGSSRERDPCLAVEADRLRTSHSLREGEGGERPRGKGEDGMLGRRASAGSRVRDGAAFMEAPVPADGRRLGLP